MKDLINKIKESGGTGLAGSSPDESTYDRWTHLFSASSNALNSTEENVFFTIILILFFLFAFLVIYNAIHLARVLKNLDGSLYQTKHIVSRIVLIIALVAANIYLLNYILVVTKII